MRWMTYKNVTRIKMTEIIDFIQFSVSVLVFTICLYVDLSLLFNLMCKEVL